MIRETLTESVISVRVTPTSNTAVKGNTIRGYITWERTYRLREIYQLTETPSLCNTDRSITHDSNQNYIPHRGLHIITGYIVLGNVRIGECNMYSGEDTLN